MALSYEELTEPERAVWDGIEAGTQVELPLGEMAVGDASKGASWGEDRQIRAQLLCELLTSKMGPLGAHPRALKLAGARIMGILDLEAATLVCPLMLRDCFLDEPIILAEAHIVALRLPGCHVPAIHAPQLRARGSVELDAGFTTQGGVDLFGAEIGGHLNLRAAVVANPDGPALMADGLTVGQGMYGQGCTTQGGVRLIGAHIGGQLSFNGAALTNPDGPALLADGLTVGQGMYGSGCTAYGGIRLIGAQIGGEVSFDAAHVEGEVVLAGAQVTADLGLVSATLTNPGGPAFIADRLRVRGIYCDRGFTAHGELRLAGAHISGPLNLTGATLTGLWGLG